MSQKARAAPQSRPKVGAKYVPLTMQSIRGGDPMRVLVVTAVHKDGTVDLAATDVSDDRTWSHVALNKLDRVG